MTYVVLLNLRLVGIPWKIKITVSLKTVFSSLDETQVACRSGTPSTAKTKLPAVARLF